MLKTPRFTIRSTMVVVAITALTMFTSTMWRRSAEFHRRADEHYGRAFEDFLNAGAATHGAFKYKRQPIAAEAAERRFLKLRSTHEEILYVKYHHAARFPWISVEPDPIFSATEDTERHFLELRSAHGKRLGDRFRNAASFPWFSIEPGSDYPAPIVFYDEQ